ncbi:unnamed protein product [Prorocentrum cordatum]|uniref:Sodium/glutamate symporter n=1 Tax=Prorocentrum cordatum TaxID=2364126 RepID=A0ABN9WEF7_9DINO|nr:unnamed protein product [Polarella glacialis]
MKDSEAFSIGCVGALLLLGDCLRTKIGFLKELQVPACLLGGLVGFFLLQLVNLISADAHRDILQCLVGWEQVPGLMTMTIFSGLVLGQPLPSPVDVWKEAGNHLLYGLAVVFGQYSVCCLVTSLMASWWDISPFFAPVVPYGFQGGHGVVAGMRSAFVLKPPDGVDFPAGFSMGMASASVGLLAGVGIGSYCVNWGNKRGLLEGLAALEPPTGPSCGTGIELAAEEPGVDPVRSFDVDGADGRKSAAVDGRKPTPPATEFLRRSSAPSTMISPGTMEQRDRVFVRRSTIGKVMLERAMLEAPQRRTGHFYNVEDRPAMGKQVVAVESIDSLAYHICLMGLAMISALGLRGILGLLCGEMVGNFPLFPFCLVTSVVLQSILNRINAPVDRATVERILNTAQDGMIVTGMALLPVGEVVEQGIPFIIASVAAIAWGFVALFMLARIMLKDYWLERGLIELGLSMGSTATGLMLLRMADPENRTPVLRQFGFKQIVHVMFVGGGAYDASALLIIQMGGVWLLFGISAVCLLSCIAAAAFFVRFAPV